MQLLVREFGVVRVKVLKNVENTAGKPKDDSMNEDSEDVEEGYEDLYTIENHFATYAFYEDSGCLSKGEIHLYLRI